MNTEEQQPAEAAPVDISALTPAEIRQRYLELWRVNVLKATLPAPARSALAGMTPAQIRELFFGRPINTAE